MPNGFHGTKADWERVEAPLRALDNKLESFSKRHGIALSRNGRNWPDRSLVWGSPVRRLIQIFLADEEGLTYNVWICASEDRDNKRYWKQELLRSAVAVTEIEAELTDLLERGRALLESWDSDSLEFATTVDRPH